jgi:hypothetical protein
MPAAPSALLLPATEVLQNALEASRVTQASRVSELSHERDLQSRATAEVAEFSDSMQL